MESLPAAQRQQIKSALDMRLEVLRRGPNHVSQFVINLDGECHLPKEAWEALLTSVVNTSAAEPSLQAAITAVCQQFTLRGGTITSGTSRYGRAVSRLRFQEFLKDEGVVASDDAARNLVSYLAKKPLSSTHRRFQRQQLSKYAMWATFNSAAPDSDPFGQLPGDADGIRERLGLDHQEEGKDMVLLDYSLPVGTEPLFPTIADAYAGVGWMPYFRPARQEDPHGRTMTWPRCVGPTCPEVIHQRITGETLEAPLRIMKAR